jgi:hypothetical protein
MRTNYLLKRQQLPISVVNGIPVEMIQDTV